MTGMRECHRRQARHQGQQPLNARAEDPHAQHDMKGMGEMKCMQGMKCMKDTQDMKGIDGTSRTP